MSSSAASRQSFPIVVSTWKFGQSANRAAWACFEKHRSALDAVEAGARDAEDDPAVHSVGLGGYPDAGGRVTLDACIMDDRGNCGSVMGLEQIRNAVSVARQVMERTRHIALVGDGALQFALANGFVRENLLSPEAERAWRAHLGSGEQRPSAGEQRPLAREQRPSAREQRPSAGDGGAADHDTIGVLAIDADGRLAGACTTSGLAFKLPGRVGDSPIIGAGLFVDGEVGCACATGQGEEILRIAGAHLVVEEMRRGAPPELACRTAVERIVRRDPDAARRFQAAFLALRVDGRVGAFAVGGRSAGGSDEPFVYAVRDRSRDELVTVPSYY